MAQRFPILRDPEGRKLRLCRFCRRPLPRYKINWCSEVCSHRAKLETDERTIRAAVFDRDRGVCSLCGFDCDAAWHQVRAYRKGLLSSGLPPEEQHHVYLEYGRLTFGGYLPPKWWKLTSLWQCDHVTPLAEGGHPSALDNRRTLCRPCHAIETSKLHKRLKVRRKRHTYQGHIPEHLKVTI